MATYNIGAHLSGHDLLGLDFVVVHREHERRLLSLGELQRTGVACRCYRYGSSATAEL